MIDAIKRGAEPQLMPIIGPPVDLTFVIPTHNRPELLRDTIHSILSQTRQPKEIIVVDNGDQGRATEVLREFGDRVRLVKSPAHQKQIARNNGFRDARTTWVATLDDDDIVCPTYLETAEQAMLDDVDIIGTNHIKFRGSMFEPDTNFDQAPDSYWEGITHPEPGANWSRVGSFPLDRLLVRVPFYPSMTIVRRSFALSIGGYNPQMLGIMSEDLEFLIRALCQGSLALVWDPLVYYRLHNSNDTSDAIGREIGRWRIFEFARRYHAQIPEYFRLALDADLPLRRAQIYKQAFRANDRELMREVRSMLRKEDWTIDQRMRAAVSALSPRNASSIRNGVIKAKRMLHSAKSLLTNI